MKVGRIVLFIFTVILLLAAMCAFFPQEGVHCFNVTLRFPSLEKVLTRHDKTNFDSFQTDDAGGILPEMGEDSASMAAFNDSIMLTADSAELQSVTDIMKCSEHQLKLNDSFLYLPENQLDYFDKFFASAEKAKAEGRTVRVLHYGDSQIELDRISCVLREYFQELFGGMGPGLLPLSQTVPTYSVTQGVTGDFTKFVAYGEGRRDAFHNYGIMGKRFHIADSVTFTALGNEANPNKHVRYFSDVKLLFNDCNGDFTATLSNDDESYSEKFISDSTGLDMFEWNTGYPINSMTLTLKGEADIYGIMLDGSYGVSVDNIPMRGSSGMVYTLIDRRQLRDSYLMANVGLIIMQFGGNSVPLFCDTTSVRTFVSNMLRQVQYVQSINPQCRILFVGPSDMSKNDGGEMVTYPLLPFAIDCLHNALVSNGIAYWDMYRMMGGRNSMVKWVGAGLAGDDYIHFTNAGAEKVGKAMIHSFSILYELYLSRKHCDFNRDTLSSRSHFQTDSILNNK